MLRFFSKSERAFINITSFIESTLRFIKEPDAEFTVKEGEKVELTCELSRSDVIPIWRHERRMVRAKPGKYDIFDEGTLHRLIIYNVSAKESGEYTVSTVELQSTSILKVHSPPSIEVPVVLKEAVKLTEGASLKLRATVHGAPVPKATWIHDDKPLDQDSRTTITLEDDITELTVRKLTADDSGIYTLKVENEFGVEKTDFSVEICGVPSVPIDVEFEEIDYDTVKLHWKPPERTGGKPIMKYIVERRDTSRMNWKIDGKTQACEYDIESLTEDAVYVFRVTAQNEIGAGPPQEAPREFACRRKVEKPSEPLHVHIVQVTETSVTLSWDQPVHDGGGIISGYVVESKEEVPDVNWNRVNPAPIVQTTYEVIDLKTNVEYTFRVAAENEGGQGRPSEVTKPVRTGKPAVPPSAPSVPIVVETGDQSAMIAWEVPIESGSEEISGYLLEMKMDGLTRWSKLNNGEAIGTSPYIVSGLIDGEAYEFRVAAISTAGVGEYSGASALVKIGEVEGKCEFVQFCFNLHINPHSDMIGDHLLNGAKAKICEACLNSTYHIPRK